jgi:hypothetical protein
MQGDEEGNSGGEDGDEDSPGRSGFGGGGRAGSSLSRSGSRRAVGDPLSNTDAPNSLPSGRLRPLLVVKTEDSGADLAVAGTARGGGPRAPFSKSPDSAMLGLRPALSLPSSQGGRPSLRKAGVSFSRGENAGRGQENLSVGMSDVHVLFLIS